MPASEKPAVVEKIFRKLWDPASGTLQRTVVTFADVVEAIREYNTENNANVSAANPANFFKDLTRRISSANRDWPTFVFEKGYTAWQTTGDGRCFEFVKVPNGQAVPFVRAVGEPSAGAPRHQVSTVSLPLAVRALARRDEPSLIQTVVRLGIIEAHMSIFSPLRATIRQVDHLQNSVKLRLSEIDAIFLATEETSPGQFDRYMITCEAKSAREDITVEQLSRQPTAILAAMPDYARVLPVVVRSLGDSKIHVVEFGMVARLASTGPVILTQTSEAIYDLTPPIPGL